ncbi:unknown [Clostridium sp. CAG:169]|nr:unknown [Clostridium sp. CAG:169]
MTFKMVEGDDDVGIHDRTSDFGFLHIFPVDRHQCFVGALQAVGNDDMAAGGKGIVAVFISAVQMVQCIFAASDIQGVAVGQERLAAQFFDQVHDDLCIVWAQIGKVARFAKMNFDSSVFVFKINVGNTCFPHQMIELFQKICSGIYLH